MYVSEKIERSFYSAEPGSMSGRPESSMTGSQDGNLVVVGGVLNIWRKVLGTGDQQTGMLEIHPSNVLLPLAM